MVRRRVGGATRLASVAGAVGLLAAALVGVASSRALAATELRLVAGSPAPPPGARALGPLAPGTEIEADVVLRPRAPGALARLATAVSTPGSGERGEYLSERSLADRFGPTRAEDRAVERSLARFGLRVLGTSPDHLTVRVAGDPGELGAAFHTGFRSYRLASGDVAYANDRPATLAGRAAGLVETVVGLSDLDPLTSSLVRERPLSRPASSAHHAARRDGAPEPCGAATGVRFEGGYTANQLAHRYGLDPLYADGDTGKGVTVGLFELEKFSLSDIATYESCYGLSTPVSVVKVDRGARGPADGSGEAALDIEDVAGLAPGASVVVYEAPNSLRGYLDELQYIVDHPTAEVVSTSWGQCEPQMGADRAAQLRLATAESTLYEFAAAEGQTWLAAAGDDGSTDCNSLLAPDDQLAVDDPGSQPYVTSVGGTTLKLGVQGHPETVWNDSGSQDDATGGGVSELWPMPAYQASAPSSLHVVNAESSGATCEVPAGYCREVPDLSADADPHTGYVVYWGGDWQPIGGTSAAAPLVAAIAVLADASRACAGASVGFLNPSLYELAGSSRYRDDFTDVTVGDNDYRWSFYAGGLYRAGTGYDMASGLGTPRATAPGGGLVAGLCSGLRVAPPGIDSISPDAGPASGGSRVTVVGFGFAHVTAVYFGWRRARFQLFQVREGRPTKLVAVAPPGTGLQWVTVVAGREVSAHVPGDEFHYLS